MVVVVEMEICADNCRGVRDLHKIRKDGSTHTTTKRSDFRRGVGGGRKFRTGKSVRCFKYFKKDKKEKN